MLFLSVPGSQTTQDRTTTRDNVVAVLPSSLPERSRHPDPSAFRSSIARPTDTSVYASSDTSRCRLQDSRPGWIRCFPFLQGSFIPYNMPVYPGALRVADHSSTIVGSTAHRCCTNSGLPHVRAPLTQPPTLIGAIGSRQVESLPDWLSLRTLT